jgi:hypothetical protein
MSIYMSFRVAQDHKATGRDMTLLTPSWTRREDSAAMTRHCSHSLLSLSIVSVFVLLVMNYIFVKLVWLIVNYIVDLMICVWYCYSVLYCIVVVYEMLYSLPVLEAPRPGSQPKHAVVKNKIKLLQLTDDYIGPPVRAVPRPPGLIYSWVMCHRRM